MGPVLGAIGTFIKAIFIGTGFIVTAGGTVGTAYILGVNLARVALLAIVAKITAPTLSLSKRAQTKTFTVRDPIAPQAFVYGEDMISGPILFSNTAGTINQDLFILIALTGHEVDSVISYRIDDTDIPLSDITGAFHGFVDGGVYAGVAKVTFAFGTDSQTAFADLTSTFSTLFNSAHTGRGWSYMLWDFNIVEGLEDAFKNQPKNIRGVVRGKIIYDPRLDTGGAGDDPDNAAFAAWSDNPALCLADFIRDDKFGMREENDRIDWDMVETAADVCDELVAIPTAATQKRYTCNATFFATEQRLSVRNELLGSMT